MHGPINVKSLNNISKWVMGFNSAFEGLKCLVTKYVSLIHAEYLIILNTQNLLWRLPLPVYY
jgi:hypothetical protein